MTKLLQRQDFNDYNIVCSTGLERFTFYVRDIKGKIKHTVYIPRTESQLIGFNECHAWIKERKSN